MLNSRQMRNEIGALRAELVLRDIPGNSVEGGRHPAHGLVTSSARDLAILQPTRGEILAVARPPRRLRGGSPLRLALDLRASALTIAYVRISSEPLAALAARTLLRHAAIVPSEIASGLALGVDWFSRADPD